MTKGIHLNDLTQAQLDAIAPVINRSMVERMSKKRLEQECVDACERAGCPIDNKLLEREE